MDGPLPLKVAIVLPTKEGFSPGRVGAIGTVVHQLATAPPDGARPPITIEVIGPELRGTALPGVTYHPAHPTWWPPFSDNRRYAGGVIRLIRKLRPAVIEVHNRPRVALAVAAACRDTPVVLVLHNDPQAMPDGSTGARRARLLRRFARIICVSDFILRRLMQDVPRPLGREPLALMNAIDIAALPPPAPEREKLVLFAGRVVKDKGTDTFVAACNLALPQMPGWRAEVIGADRFQADSPETDFVRKVKDSAGLVVMRGYQPREVVLAAMSRCAIVVVPSRWDDPCPLSALEAMACGAALITTRRGGLPEIGGDAGLYVDPEKPEELADLLQALAADADRLAAAAAACRRQAARFDLPGTVARWNAIRRAITAGGGRR